MDFRFSSTATSLHSYTLLPQARRLNTRSSPQNLQTGRVQINARWHLVPP